MRVKKIAVVFLRTSRSIGKRLHDGFLQVRIGAQSKLSSSASANSDTRRTASISPTVQFSTENHHNSNMSPNDWEDGQYVQSAQVDLYEDLPLPPPPPLDAIPQGPPPPMPLEQPRDLSRGKKTYDFAEIDRQYNELAKTRQDLMDYRFRMQRDRKNISNIREQTGSKEGSVLNQLRNFLNKESIVLPREIEETMEQIEALRDQLGPLEADYEDVERYYNRKEVEYGEQESDMIDRLGDIHFQYLDQFGSLPTQANGSTLEKSITAVPASGELVRQDGRANDTVSKEALQLVVKANLNPDVHEQAQTQEVDDTYTAEIELYANREHVEGWLYDMVFQSPLQQMQRHNSRQIIDLDQISPLDQISDKWHWINSVGAQFQSTDSKLSRGAVKKPDVTISRPIFLSRRASANLLRAIFSKGSIPYARGHLHGKPVFRMAPLWESWSTGDISLTNNQETFVTGETEAPRPYKVRIHRENRRRSLSCSSITLNQLLASQTPRPLLAIQKAQSQRSL